MNILGWWILIPVGLGATALHRHRKDAVLLPALLLKIFCGIAVGLVYQYYYPTGDTWNFFQDGSTLTKGLIENPLATLQFLWTDDAALVESSIAHLEDRYLYMVKWVGVLGLLTAGNYWALSVLFSVISFAGAYVLYVTVAKIQAKAKSAAALAFLFVPSIVFWSSGLIKESLAFAGLCTASAVFYGWYKGLKINLLQVLVAIFAVWIMWSLKYYWAGIWMAVVASLIIVRIAGKYIKSVERYPLVAWIVLLVIMFGLVTLLHPNFYLQRILWVIKSNHDAFQAISAPGTAIQYYQFDGNALSMIMNAPLALMSGLFRPFIFEANNLVQWAAAVENLMLVVLFVFWLKNVRQLKWGMTRGAIIFYIIVLGVFLALSTPNFGSLSRFRVGFTPFLWFGLLYDSSVLKYIVKLLPKA